MLFSMLCWGSWANTQKIDKRCRFELFYWDYIWGLLACALLFGLTFGNRHPASSDSSFQSLSSASTRSLLEAFFGGVIFNVGNLLLLAAISVAGTAVAFPIGAGLAPSDFVSLNLSLPFYDICGCTVQARTNVSLLGR
jgi:glucose uptake protein